MKISGSKVYISLLNFKVSGILDFAASTNSMKTEFSIDKDKVKAHEYFFLSALINDVKNKYSSFESIIVLQKSFKTLSLLTAEYEKLQKAFPTEIKSKNGNRDQLIVLEVIDRKSHCRVILSVSVNGFINLVCNSARTLLHADVIYGKNGSVKNVTTAFISNNGNCFSWLSNCVISL